jgi:hypothetical protein
MFDSVRGGLSADDASCCCSVLTSCLTSCCSVIMVAMDIMVAMEASLRPAGDTASSVTSWLVGQGSSGHFVLTCSTVGCGAKKRLAIGPPAGNRQAARHGVTHEVRTASNAAGPGSNTGLCNSNTVVKLQVAAWVQFSWLLYQPTKVHAKSLQTTSNWPRSNKHTLGLRMHLHSDSKNFWPIPTTPCQSQRLLQPQRKA